MDRGIEEGRSMKRSEMIEHTLQELLKNIDSMPNRICIEWSNTCGVVEKYESVVHLKIQAIEQIIKLLEKLNK